MSQTDTSTSRFAGVPAAGAHDASGRRTARFGYPVVLDVHGVAVLVVGAGRVGARKLAGLAAAGANVRLVAPQISDHVERDLAVEIVERCFEPRDLDGVRLVVSATGEATVDATVADAARARGIWMNAADQPQDCSFIVPAIVRRGRVSVAVSTDGASPALARELRDELERRLSPAVGDVAERFAEQRAAIHSAGRSTEDVDWSAHIEQILPGAGLTS